MVTELPIFLTQEDALVYASQSAEESRAWCMRQTIIANLLPSFRFEMELGEEYTIGDLDS